jgi:hypothetical protein
MSIEMDKPTAKDMERDPELDIAAFENRKHFYPYPVLFLWLRRAVAAEAEVKRLKWRLNHQTDDDAEACRRGEHEDCGK